MKKSRILLSAVAVAVIAVGGMVACKKTGTDFKPEHETVKKGLTAECSCSIEATSDSTISSNITSDLYLSNTTTYSLNGLIFVTNGATLYIQEGTRILGLAGNANQPGGGLVVTRGSKIHAVGTSACPIVFTSYRYNNSPQPGDWSGVVLLGKAPTNNWPANVEGINTALYPGIDVQYGAPDGERDANDNSGIMQFVRIEYGGYVLSPNNEINGLTLAGVGAGTTIDYVEVFAANDDSFEFFGGTVNPSHLLSINGFDDMFDTDNGFRGTISYALGMSDPNRPDQSQSNGLESDNDAAGDNAQPNTHAIYHNITIIGVPNGSTASTTTGGPSGVGKFGRAGHLRRNTEFEIYDGIFVGFNYGLSLDGALGFTPQKYLDSVPPISKIQNTYVQAFGTSATPLVGPYSLESNGTAATGAGFSNSTRFYDTAIARGNTGEINSDATIYLEDPFTRPSPCDGAVNFFAKAFTDADTNGAGAFPGRVDWTVVNGSANWTRYF